MFTIVGSLIKKILLAIVSLCIFFLLAEGFFRLKYHPEKIEFSGLFEYDPEKSYRLKNNTIGEFEGKKIKTNEYGYQGSSFSVNKDQNEWRILFLGDSITFGHGVDFENTFTQQYQASLSSEYPNKRITTINAGVPGYSSMQEYFDFIRSLKFKPDVAVVQFTLNDVIEPFLFQLELGGSGIDYHGVEDMSFWHFYLSQRSALYLFLIDMMKIVRFGTTDDKLIQSKAKKFESLDAEQLVSSTNDPRQNVQWSEYFRWLEKFANTCEQNDISCYILISPYTFQLELNIKNASPQQKIIDFAQKHNLKVIDMLPLLQESARQEIIMAHKLPLDTEYDQIISNHLDDLKKITTKYFLDYDHYTPLGHAFVSDELMKQLNKPTKE